MLIFAQKGDFFILAIQIQDLDLQLIVTKKVFCFYDSITQNYKIMLTIKPLELLHVLSL